MKLFKVLVLGLVVSVLLIFSSSMVMADKPIVLRSAHFLQDTPLAGGEHFFADEVYKRTNGKVKIEVYFGETLGKAKELLNLVKSGTVDMAAIVPSWYPAQFPLWGGPCEIPFVMKNIDTVQQVSIRIPKEIPGVQEEIEKQNIKYLFWSEPLVHYTMFSTKPIVKFEDLKGVKVRTYGRYLPQAMKAAGAVGVTIFTAETYESLKRGVIDASIWPIHSGYFMKNYEVAPHVCLWDIQSICGYNHMMNLNVWNSLPADVRQVILEVEQDNVKAARARCLKLNEKAMAGYKEEGAIMHPISASERQKWIDACPNFIDQWVQRCEKLGKGDAARQMRDLWLEIVKQYDK